MIRAAVLMIATLLLSSPALAQDKGHTDIVAKIRADYGAIGAKIEKVKTGGEAAKDADIVLSELVVNKGGHNWPAVGNYRVIYRFWYEWEPGQPFPSRLRKVEVETTSSARTFYQEYFFSAEGRLIFYYERAAGAPPKEMRSYYTGEKLVRMVTGATVNDTPTPGERKTAETVIRAAQRVMETFKTAQGLRGN